MLLRDLLREYIYECEIKKYSPRTIKKYRNNIKLFFNYLEKEYKIITLEQVSHIQIKNYLKYLTNKGCKETYVNGILKSLRGLYKYCEQEEYVNNNPLPNRETIIISNTVNIVADNCTTVKSLAEAFDLVKGEDEVFVAGGGQVYKEALPYSDKIYLTVIDKIIDGNVYFPQIDKNDFVKTYEKRIENEISYTYYTYERKRNYKRYSSKKSRNQWKNVC